MNIALDISPLKNDNQLQHRVRGTGMYIENLKESLPKYYPKNKYTFFARGEKIPSNIDLVHYTYFEPFFLTLPIFSNFKTIVTVHDLIPFVFPKHFPVGLKGKAKWQLQRLALQRTDAIITDSKCSKKDILHKVGINENKIHVVYLAAARDFTKIEDNELRIKNVIDKYHLPKKFVLYVGDVTWNKNLPRLIKAVSLIKLPLVMVGKTLVEKYFDRTNLWNQDIIKVQELAKSNKNIFRLGFVESNDLVSLYNAATVFAMPSLYEGFGLPILEAMSCGCPVVTSKEGSIPEIAADAVLNVDAYSVDSISQGIKEVFDNQNVQKSLSLKGIEQSKRFTWHKTAEQTIAVYKSVVVR